MEYNMVFNPTLAKLNYCASNVWLPNGELVREQSILTKVEGDRQS